MIDQFIEDCKNHPNSQVNTYGDYFKNNYAGRPNEWALCLRSLEAYTTNMVCESFHKKLKRNSAYMDGKFNKRMDVLLGHLFAIEGEIMNRDIITYKSSKKQTAINFKAHQLASTQSISLIHKKTEKKLSIYGWQIQ